MNLDDLATFSKIDTHHMHDQIGSLPDQLETAWALGGVLDYGGAGDQVSLLGLHGGRCVPDFAGWIWDQIKAG